MKVGGTALMAYGNPYFRILGLILVMTASGMEQRRLRREAINAYNASLKDRTIVVRSTTEPLRIAYGRVRTGGVLDFALSSGTLSQYLHEAIVLFPGHQIDAIESLAVNDKEVGPLDGNGNPGPGSWFSLAQTNIRAEFTISTHSATQQYTLLSTPVQNSVTVIATDPTGYAIPQTVQLPVVSVVGTLVTFNSSTAPAGWIVTLNYLFGASAVYANFRRYLGTATQTADQTLIDASGGKWTSTAQGRGRPYVAASLTFNDTFEAIEVSQVSAVIRGKLCYDPRKDSSIGGSGTHRSDQPSTWEWTDNPALWVRDYLTTALGFGCSSSEIDETTVMAAASVCDEPISFTDRKRAKLYGIANDFNNVGNLEGWEGTNQTLSVTNGYLTITPTTADPILHIEGLAIAGTTCRTVRARIKRLSGTGWDGSCFYSTGGHSYSSSYYKILTEPTYDGNGWAVITWDMENLTAGGTDWINSTITGIRLDIGEGPTDNFQIDWIYVGAENIQKRYFGGGMISTEADRLENLSVLLSTMVGTCTWVQGKFRVYAGAYRTPTISLDDSDVMNPQDTVVRSHIERRDLFNVVKGTFVDPDQFWQQVDYPPVANAAYQTEDGGNVIELDYQMPLVTDGTVAQRIAKVVLEQGRRGFTVVASFGLRAYPLTPGSTVTLTIALYGITNQVFRVTDRQFSLDGLVVLTLVREEASIYNWNLGEATPPVEAPVSNLPTPWNVLQPENLVLLSGPTVALLQADGTTVSRILLTWDQSTDSHVLNGGTVEVQYRRADEELWSNAMVLTGDAVQVYVAPVQDGAHYYARVRFTNGLGVKSQWTFSELHAVTPYDLAPPAPINLNLSVNGAGVRRFTWVMTPPRPDVVSFELAWKAGATITWATADGKVLVGSASKAAASNTYTWETSVPIAAGTYSFEVRSINNNGVESTSGVQLLDQVLPIAGAIPDGSVTFPKLPTLWSLGGIVTPDPGFEDLTAWNLGVNGTTEPWRVSISGLGTVTSLFGRYALGSSVLSSYFYSKPVPIDPNRAYRALGNAVKGAGGDNRPCYFIVAFFDKDMTLIQGGTDPANWALYGTYHYWGPTSGMPAVWTPYGQTFGPGHGSSGVPGIPTNAKFMSVGALLTYDAGGGPYSGTNYCNALRIVDVALADQIGDGTITAPKIPDRTIGYLKMKNGTGGYGVITEVVEPSAITTQSAVTYHADYGQADAAVQTITLYGTGISIVASESTSPMSYAYVGHLWLKFDLANYPTVYPYMARVTVMTQYKVDSGSWTDYVGASVLSWRVMSTVDENWRAWIPLSGMLPLTGPGAGSTVYMRLKLNIDFFDGNATAQVSHLYTVNPNWTIWLTETLREFKR